MNLVERHQLVASLVMRDNRSSVADLARATGASEMTIRRDLEVLEKRGVLIRVHGGAVSALLSGVEPPYAVRAALDLETKDRLAAVVLGLVRDGETVALDTGTTAVAVARAMANRQLTVTPLSLRSAFALADSPGVRLLLPGGQVRPGELSFYGEVAVRLFDDLCYDTFVLSCCGLDIAVGATAHNFDDVSVKRAAVRAARRVILVATAEKLGRVALGRICPVDQIQTVVTNAQADSPVVADLRSLGVEVMHPPA